MPRSEGIASGSCGQGHVQAVPGGPAKASAMIQRTRGERSGPSWHHRGGDSFGMLDDANARSGGRAAGEHRSQAENQPEDLHGFHLLAIGSGPIRRTLQGLVLALRYQVVLACGPPPQEDRQRRSVRFRSASPNHPHRKHSKRRLDAVGSVARRQKERPAQTAGPMGHLPSASRPSLAPRSPPCE